MAKKTFLLEMSAKKSFTLTLIDFLQRSNFYATVLLSNIVISASFYAKYYLSTAVTVGGLVASFTSLLFKYYLSSDIELSVPIVFDPYIKDVPQSNVILGVIQVFRIFVTYFLPGQSIELRFESVPSDPLVGTLILLGTHDVENLGTLDSDTLSEMDLV